jgi:hypothetical protein
MAQIHINSNDVNSGTSYQGQWDLSQSITGRITVVSHYIESGDIPWVYPGCNGLSVLQTALPNALETAVFDVQTSDAEVDVIAAINATFDAISYLAGTSTVFIPADREYEVTLSESVVLEWTKAGSTAKYVFGKRNSADEVGTVFRLSARDIESRPKYLDVHVQEASSSAVGSRLDPGDLFISTFDQEVRGGYIILNSSTRSLNIEFRRMNVPQFACPMELIWDMIFTI